MPHKEQQTSARMRKVRKAGFWVCGRARSPRYKVPHERRKVPVGAVRGALPPFAAVLPRAIGEHFHNAAHLGIGQQIPHRLVPVVLSVVAASHHAALAALGSGQTACTTAHTSAHSTVSNPIAAVHASKSARHPKRAGVVVIPQRRYLNRSVFTWRVPYEKPKSYQHCYVKSYSHSHLLLLI